ncbi:sensor histidine kinase [Microvirga calopogonii]|uniref:sensor histidine kinase n=1 Tax=Microvirga calopogonii TaxID=2078013 RepID=UPI000E0D6EA8|nr:PAS domain S-box protein [Microvirga calopogonii]
MRQTSEPNQASWPVGGGRMGERIRAFDWSQTSLGPMEAWPERLRMAVDLVLASPMPMNLLWGPDFVQIYNDGFQPFFGTKHPTSLGQSANECWAEFQHENDLIYARVFAGESVTFENHAWSYARGGEGDLEEAYFTTYCTPARDESGAVAGILTTAFETTQQVKAEAERQQAEQALRVSEAQLQAAVDLVGLSPYGWDPATGALEWDARLKALWGLPPDAHVDQDVWLSGIHPEDRLRVEAAVAECSDPAGDGVYHIEYRVIGIGDGVERWVSTHGRTTFKNGQPVGFVGAAMDITERKRAEQQLRESQERFRNLTNLIPIFVWSVDPVGAITFANEQWFTYTGITDEPPDQWPDLVFAPDERDPNVTNWQRALQTGAAFDIEARIRRHDGAYRWYLTRAVPVRDAEGKVTGWFSAATDIHERKVAEEHRTVLLAELQHRVRNTLAVIRSIARQTAETSETVEDYALHFEGRLNALARVQAAVTRDPTAGIALGLLVSEELLSCAAQEGERFSMSGPDVCLRPKAAETLGLAIHELATNAVKYGALSTPRGHVTVAWLRIPIQSGRGFRFDAGQHSGMKPDTVPINYRTLSPL